MRMEDIERLRNLTVTGDVGAALELATMLHHDYCVEDYLEEIFSLYLMAFKSGSPEAAMGLGSIYKNIIGGTIGFRRAVFWYETACSMGHVPACCNLALAYESGSMGLNIDKKKAYEYTKKGTEAMRKIKRSKGLDL